MIILFAVAAWILALSIVVGLCAAARAGDGAACALPAAGGGQLGARRPSQNRHVVTLRRLDHTPSTIESAMAAHAASLGHAQEGSHPVHRIDRKPIVSTRERGRAVRELRRAAGI